MLLNEIECWKIYYIGERIKLKFLSVHGNLSALYRPILVETSSIAPNVLTTEKNTPQAGDSGIWLHRKGVLTIEKPSLHVYQ